MIAYSKDTTFQRKKQSTHLKSGPLACVIELGFTIVNACYPMSLADESHPPTGKSLKNAA